MNDIIVDDKETNLEEKQTINNVGSHIYRVIHRLIHCYIVRAIKIAFDKIS